MCFAFGELWVSIGADPAAVDEICELRMHWSGDHLYVVEGSGGQPSDEPVAHRVSFVLLSLWSFITFSESRWISVGRSSRCLVRGLLSGLEHIVSAILEDPRQSSHHIAGFRRLVPPVREFLVVS